nr:hypothetical protein [Tanacetum cinerariifolium]
MDEFELTMAEYIDLLAVKSAEEVFLAIVFENTTKGSATCSAPKEAKFKLLEAAKLNTHIGFGSGQCSMHQINHILGDTYKAGRARARLIINLTLGLQLSYTNTTTCPCSTVLKVSDRAHPRQVTDTRDGYPFQLVVYEYLPMLRDVEMTNFKCTYVLPGGIALTKEYEKLKKEDAA